MQVSAFDVALDQKLCTFRFQIYFYPPPTLRTNLINVIYFRLTFSVMSAPAEAERFCAAEKLVGYRSEWRTNASQSLDTAQRFSAKERLREVKPNCSLMTGKF